MKKKKDQELAKPIPHLYQSFPIQECAEPEDCGEGICDLFKEINAIIEEEVEPAVIRDAEPGEMLQNWTSTPILMSRTLRNISYRPANVMSCHELNEQNETDDDKVDDYEEENGEPDYVAEEFRQFENQHKPNLEETETSFVDCYAGYHQILMDEEDAEKTAFITPWGVYHYKVMPFGLKNAGATYMRTMTTIFHDMIHKEIEVYVDDVIIKSRESSDHLTHLRKFFERLRRYNLKLNPAKCAFGVPSGKLLGFIVSRRAQSTVVCEPIFKLLKKDAPTKWTEECQTAFDAIKSYLSNPPVLVPPREGSPLLLYLSVSDSAFGCVLGQHDETGKKERAIYYKSKKFTPYESRYTLLERTCFALTWLAQKLRHYLSSYTTYLISRMDPLKYIFQKAMPIGKLAKWQMLLSEFDIVYVTQMAIKAQALADHLSENPVQGEWAVKNPKIIPYVQYVQNLSDALATIALMIKHPDTDYIDPLDIELKEHPVHCSHVESEPDGLPWYFDIKRYLESGTYPEDTTSNQKKSIRRMALNFFLNGEVLYRRTPDLVLLRCVDAVEAVRLIEQIHAGVCGSYKSVTNKVVADFVRNNLICRFGVPKSIITDNGANLNSHLMKEICEQFKITHRKSTAYRPQMNGAVEAANKNIKKILRKMIDKHRGWHEMFPYALLGYRTTVRTSTGATPYLLVYGTEAVIPVEVEIPSLRIIQEAELSNDEWVRKRVDQLTLIDEKKMVAVCHGQLYRQRMTRAFHKRVRARNFEVGQLVLKRIFPHQDEYKGKFAPNWQGPYMVRKVLSGGALVLSEMDGSVWPKSINSDAVKRYYGDRIYEKDSKILQKKPSPQQVKLKTFRDLQLEQNFLRRSQKFHDLFSYSGKMSKIVYSFALRSAKFSRRMNMESSQRGENYPQNQ
ncbi:uncharacterized protein LOC114076872 [Solanum pennellii]|uniref:Uncharacterized protein LOC114076872 n=1 Tax=Solanum pennellii TaxID=28526 RepID=A0ABM1V9F2_SOLPN|nr:uncharacterized protein LOC114076872 [Solanum pennellii]